ncbi:hypothetical protein EJB05_14094, partial [Eragrostis curvula]
MASTYDFMTPGRVSTQRDPLQMLSSHIYTYTRHVHLYLLLQNTLFFTHHFPKHMVSAPATQGLHIVLELGFQSTVSSPAQMSLYNISE